MLKLGSSEIAANPLRMIIYHPTISRKCNTQFYAMQGEMTTSLKCDLKNHYKNEKQQKLLCRKWWETKFSEI